MILPSELRILRFLIICTLFWTPSTSRKISSKDLYYQLVNPGEDVSGFYLLVVRATHVDPTSMRMESVKLQVYPRFAHWLLGIRFYYASTYKILFSINFIHPYES